MNTATPLQAPPTLLSLRSMGVLLERLERLPRGAAASQYRDVAVQVQRLLAETEPGPALSALLQALPATAELYENMNYANAGLCRSSLDAALQAELAARAVIAKMGRGAGNGR
jgi:hypothetical protein